jgi:hypothetical protein
LNGVLYVLSFGTTGSKPSITAAFVKVKWDGEPPLVENMIPRDEARARAVKAGQDVVEGNDG